MTAAQKTAVREQFARIIDPTAWEHRNPSVASYSPDDEYERRVNDSLGKADRILAEIASREPLPSGSDLDNEFDHGFEAGLRAAAERVLSMLANPDGRGA